MGSSPVKYLTGRIKDGGISEIASLYGFDSSRLCDARFGSCSRRGSFLGRLCRNDLSTMIKIRVSGKERQFILPAAIEADCFEVGWRLPSLLQAIAFISLEHMFA
jgi:hypothetical protein